MDLNERLSDHFTLYELTRSETASRLGIRNIPNRDEIVLLKLLCEAILEPVRETFGPYRPNSGYRCLELNRAVGSYDKSQHVKCEAVDIEIAGLPNYDLAKWIEANLVYDQLILECYTPGVPNSGWVHVSFTGAGENRRKTLTYSDGKYTIGLNA